MGSDELMEFEYKLENQTSVEEEARTPQTKLALLPESMGRDWEKYSGVQLAFIGDAVFDLYIRSLLLQEMYRHSIKDLHQAKVKLVKAASQAAFINNLRPVLSEEELGVFKRARNSSSKAAPKSASPVEYRNATGFEALLGFLYIRGDEVRLRELLELCRNSNTNNQHRGE